MYNNVLIYGSQGFFELQVIRPDSTRLTCGMGIGLYIIKRKIFNIVTPQSGNSQRDWSKSCHVL